MIPGKRGLKSCIETVYYRGKGLYREATPQDSTLKL